MLTSTWPDIGRLLLTGTLAYAGLVLVLRLSGKRTLSKMNAFDLVVTVALGSSLATVLLSKNVPVLEGIVAFVLLAGLQFALSWLSVRSGTVRRFIKSQQTLVFYRGEFQVQALRRERLAKSEVRAAVREHGYASLEAIEAVVLETAGDLSVLPKHPDGDRSAMVDTEGSACDS